MNLATRIPPEFWNAIRNNYEKGSYQFAILDAFFLLTELLRQKSGITSDGADLVGEVLALKNPKIKLNRLETESDKNIQRGLSLILQGLYTAIRNPRAHGTTNDTREDTENIILFMAYLYNIIAESKPFYSPDDFALKVFDPEFYLNDKYAELLVDEIPIGKIHDTMIFLYRNRTNYINIRNIFREYNKFEFVFIEILSRITKDDLKEISNIISKDLLEEKDYVSLAIICCLINDNVWEEIKPVSKTRIEQIIIKSIKKGVFKEKQPMDDISIFGYFSTHLFILLSPEIKRELYIALEDKIKINDSLHREYYINFILPSMKLISEKIPKNLTRVLIDRLKSQDYLIGHVMKNVLPYPKEVWPENLVKAYERFEEQNPSYDEDEDQDEDDPSYIEDLPF